MLFRIISGIFESLQPFFLSYLINKSRHWSSVFDNSPKQKTIWREYYFGAIYRQFMVFFWNILEMIQPQCFISLAWTFWQTRRQRCAKIPTSVKKLDWIANIFVHSKVITPSIEAFVCNYIWFKFEAPLGQAPNKKVFRNTAWKTIP